MFDEKISVIVPVYNVEKYLEKCVNSIISQTYPNIELVLVDDGSTDNSGKICDDLKKNDQRIKVVHKENGGLSSARNAGINESTGAYYGFIDSDDFIDKEMFSTLYEAIKRTGKDIASCGRYVDVFGQYCVEEFVLGKERVFSREEAIAEVLLLEKVDVSACDKLYKNTLFETVRYPEGQISEDAAVIFDLLDKSNGVVHVGKPFYHYVFRKNSITKSSYSARKHDVITNIKSIDSFISQKHPSLMTESRIYACICSAALIMDMKKDNSSIKKYPEHYKDYNYYFNRGFFEAVKCSEIKKKMKVRLIAIKTHTLPFFYLLKKCYDRFRISKNEKT